MQQQHKGRKNQNREKYNGGGGGHWRQDNRQERYDAAREKRREAYEDTVTYFTKQAQFDYVVPRPFWYTFESLDADKREIKPILAEGEKMKVFIENMDTLDMAKQMIDEGAKMGETIFINMASKFKPGGGVRNGAGAQEEELFRRTNAFLHLPIDAYELDTDLDNCETIFSRNVIVVKDTEYKLLPQRYWCNMISLAAIRHPPLKQDYSYRNPKHAEVMEKKIHGIFKIAYHQGQKYLVLGAIGSGAYGHDAYFVAKMFRKALKKFDGCFKAVGFAVLCGRDTYNYDTFVEEVQEGFKADTQ